MDHLLQVAPSPLEGAVVTDVGSGISGIRTSVPVPILPGKDRLAQGVCQGDGGGTDCGLRSREIQDRSAGMSSSASFAPAGHRGPHHPVSAFVSTKRKKTEKPRRSYRGRCSILKRVTSKRLGANYSRIDCHVLVGDDGFTQNYFCLHVSTQIHGNSPQSSTLAKSCVP